MTVYLLHLDKPMSRGVSKSGTPLVAGHYIGFTDDLVGRLMEHATGHGARLLQVCLERGIDWRLARTWDGADRAFERRLKRGKWAPQLCPICNPEKALHLMRLEAVQ